MSFVRGAVLQALWLWFVVPFGVPALSLAHATGIVVLASFACKSGRADLEDGTPLSRAVIFGLVQCALALLFGYIAFRFMP